MKFINTGPEPFFEDVVNHMAAICGVPIAAIALEEGSRHWLNEPEKQRGRECSECPLDALGWIGRGASVSNNFMPPPEMIEICERLPRSYVATPLIIDGRDLGSLFIADTSPREWTQFHIDYMVRAARLVAGHFEARALLAERDIRIELERRLQDADALHSAIVSTMSEGLAVYAADGSIILSNNAAKEILGESKRLFRENQGGFRGLIDETGAPMQYEALPTVRSFRTGCACAGVFGIKQDDGQTLWLSLKATPMTLGPDKPATVVTTFHDISEQKRQEEELRNALEAAKAASVAKSAFLANMSHEIRTPLNGVLGMAQALRSETLTPAQSEKVDLMIESGISLMTVLNDILDLSKVEAGKIEISPVDLDVRAALTRAVELYRGQATDKGVGLDLTIDDAMPQGLRVDPVRARQCLMNLISNAVKFTSAGKVSVEASWVDGADGKLLKMVVRDTGIGMNAEQLGRLFSDFSQADESTTRRFGGTGLGLSISRKLARLMGGDIVAESVIGEGSAFTLTVGADVSTAEAPAKPETPATQPAISLVHGKRVLVVDDNPINRRVAQMMLKLHGVVIAEAENGVQALEKLAAEPFDLVLMDVHMPVMDGNVAVARIRASSEPWAKIPVIALTADAMSGDREKLIAGGMDAYVAKPIDQRDLLTTINALLFGRAQQAA